MAVYAIERPASTTFVGAQDSWFSSTCLPFTAHCPKNGAASGKP